MKKTFVIKPRKVMASKYVKAEDTFDDEESDYIEEDEAEPEVDDEVDDSEVDILDDVVTEEVDDILVNNNIDKHFIAECSACQGIFISAVIQSEQPIDSISGKCPLCNKETDQYLKWVINEVN